MRLSRRQALRIFSSAAIAAAVPKLPTLEPIVANLDFEPVGNSILSVDMIVREAMRIAHNRGAFVHALNRQYDAKFAELMHGRPGGTKPHGTLRVREPVQYKLARALVTRES